MLGRLVNTNRVAEASGAGQGFWLSIEKQAIAPRMIATLGYAAGCWLSMAAAAIAAPAVILDGSTNSTVVDTVTNLPSDCSLSCLIQGSDQAGGNLYHSFSQFNVPAGVTVTLDGQGLERILMRVTGGQRTNIHGLLQVQGETDLFLLNPAGLFIGADGRLDIQGSFIGSSAEAVLFENGDAFVTPNTSAPLLSVSVPIGLQFDYLPNGSNTTGTFSVAGNGSQPPVWQPGTVGKTFALVIDSSTPATFAQRSHAVTAGGFVLANAGSGMQRVNLAQTTAGWDFDFIDVPQVRAVQLDRANISTSLSSPGGSIEFDGDITLTHSDILLQSQDSIAAGEFKTRGASLTLDQSSLTSQTGADGGDINLLMEVGDQELSLKNGSRISTISTLGQAGNITFEGSSVSLDGLSSITTESQDGGGNISLLASDEISLRNKRLFSVQSNGSGTVGDITIEALGPDGFQLSDSQILSTVETAGGNISIVAPQELILDKGELIASTDSAGANVRLITDGVLQVKDRNFISLNSGDGTYAGTGGNLFIEASQVDSVDRDTDIKVVGPVGNFTRSISSDPEFIGFARPVFNDVIRGNGRSEIQITELAPFPEPPVPPIPEIPTPELERPTPELEIPNLETLLLPLVIETPELLGEPTRIVVTPTITIPITYVVEPVFEQANGSEEEDNLQAFGVPLFLGGNEDSEELALAGSSDSAYRARRPGCESKAEQSGQGRLRLHGRGGLPDRPGSLGTSSQALADLGSPGFAVGANLDGVVWGDWQRPVGNNPIETGGQPRLHEAEGWQINASGQVQLLAGAQSPDMGPIKPCRIMPVAYLGS